MLVLEGYGMLVPSRPIRRCPKGRSVFNKRTGKCEGGLSSLQRPTGFPMDRPKPKPAMLKPAPLRCPDGSIATKQGCKPKPPMLRPDSLKVPIAKPLMRKQPEMFYRPAKPAVMVKPSPKPEIALIEKAKVEVTPEIKAPVTTKPKQEGPSIATMAMVGIPLAVVTYFMAT